MSATKPLVLLTGASGFVGYLTLVSLLKSGYRVRAAVRSESKAAKIRNSESIKDINPSPEALSFVVVPDMTIPGAYDTAARDVTYIVHIASPIPSFGSGDGPSPEEYESYFVQTPVASDIGMLQSAANAGGSVKRIVLTSSSVAIVPFPYFSGAPEVDYTVRFNAESRIPSPTGPFASEFEAYAAGKAAALNGVEKWVTENGEAAGFDLVTIVPAWIFGHDEMLESAAAMRSGGSTNSVLLGLLLGNKNDVAFDGSSVLGADVAKAHVLALDDGVKGNQSFITAVAMEWEDAVEVVRTEFANDVQAGRLSIEGKQPTKSINMEASKTEEVLGIKLEPFEKQVKQVARQYLELLSMGQSLS